MRKLRNIGSESGGVGASGVVCFEQRHCETFQAFFPVSLLVT